MDALEEVPPAKRSALVVGKNPLGNALLIIEVKYKAGTWEGQEAEIHRVPQVGPPIAFHCLPVTALHSGDQEVMRHLRTVFHETTGPQSESRQGQRLLDTLLYAMSENLDEEIQGLMSSLDKAPSQPLSQMLDNERGQAVDTLQSVSRLLTRLRRASALRACWMAAKKVV
jgi:hypothetical protein